MAFPELSESSLGWDISRGGGGGSEGGKGSEGCLGGGGGTLIRQVSPDQCQSSASCFTSQQRQV